jgi:hypothetical protein
MVHRNVITLLGGCQIVIKLYGLMGVLLLCWIPIKNMRILYEMTMMLYVRRIQ